MMRDPRGKAFTTTMTDQCFRSKKSSRVAHQMIYLLNQFGIPRYLDSSKRLSLAAFQLFGRTFLIDFCSDGHLDPAQANKNRDPSRRKTRAFKTHGKTKKRRRSPESQSPGRSNPRRRRSSYKVWMFISRILLKKTLNMSRSKSRRFFLRSTCSDGKKPSMCSLTV